MEEGGKEAVGRREEDGEERQKTGFEAVGTGNEAVVGPEEEAMEAGGAGQRLGGGETATEGTAEQRRKTRKGRGGEDGEEFAEVREDGACEGQVDVQEQGGHEGFDEQDGLAGTVGGGTGAGRRRNGRGTAEGQESVADAFGGERGA